MRMTSRPPSRFRRLLRAGTLGVAGALCFPGQTHAQAEPLSLAEILTLRSHGVSVIEIVRSAREFCLAFVVDDSVARVLKSASGDTTLADGLRGLCTRAPSGSLLPLTVLLDDDLRVDQPSVVQAGSAQPCVTRYDAIGFRLQNRRSMAACTIDYPASHFRGNVRLETLVAFGTSTAEHVASFGFGRQGDADDRYTFNIHSEGRFELCRLTGGRCRSLIPWTPVSDIRTGPGARNALAVEIRGRRIALFVNDAPVGTHEVAAPVTGGVVLGAGPASEAVYARLTIRRLSVP